MRRSLALTRHCVTASKSAAMMTVAATLDQTMIRTRLALFSDKSSMTSLKIGVRLTPSRLLRASRFAGSIAREISLCDFGGVGVRPDDALPAPAPPAATPLGSDGVIPTPPGGD